METIPKDKCQKIGFFRKTHGVRGELTLEFENRFEESIENAERFFVDLDGYLVPFFIEEEGFRFKTSNTAIVKFLWVDNENYARRMIGQLVYLFNDEIVDEKEESIQSYLLNFTVSDVKLGEIGTIENVDDFSGNIVLTVNYHGEELLIPFNEDFLVSLDEQKKRLTMNLPEGLIGS